MIKNKKGSISPVAFLLTFLVLSFATVSIANSLINLTHIKFRNKSYLCAQEIINQTKTYYMRQSRLNLAVKTSYYLQFSPVPSIAVAAVKTHKSLKLLQNMTHISYVKNISHGNWCIWKNSVQLAITTPVKLKSKILLQRDFDGSLVFRKKWKTYLTFLAQKPLDRLKHSFALELNFTLKSGKTTHNFYLQSKEISAEVFLRLKESAGP